MPKNLENTVVIFGPEIWTLQRNGGVSRYCFELINQLSNLGVRICVLQSENNNSYSRQFEPAIVRKLKDESQFEIESVIRDILQEFSTGIYHATYFNKKNIDIAKKLNLKTFVTVHDLIGDIYPEKIRWYQRRNKTQEKVSISCDRVIAVSRNTKDDLVKYYGINPEKIGVIYLGVTQMEARRPLDFGEEYPFVLHVGKRDGYKNFRLTLEALAQEETLKEIHIIAFGGGEFSREEKEYVNSLGMDKRTHQYIGDDTFLGFLYKSAIALVYPSYYEGFGIPPLEAMQFECPVIASNRASIPEVCGDSVLYIDPTSRESLQNAIAHVLKYKDTEKIKFALKHSKKYSWEKTAKETLIQYQSILKEKL